MLPSFTDEDKAALCDNWVSIAIAIHEGISVKSARKLGVPSLDIHLDTTREIYELDDVDDEVKNFARKAIEAVEAFGMSQPKQLFIHNDLQFHNLLIDPETLKITGLIDWTDICIGPIERELSLWEWTHDDQIEEVAKRYEAKTGIKIDVNIARMFRHIEEVCDYVEYTKGGEAEEAAESLAHIRQWIAEAA